GSRPRRPAPPRAWRPDTQAQRAHLWFDGRSDSSSFLPLAFPSVVIANPADSSGGLSLGALLGVLLLAVRALLLALLPLLLGALTLLLRLARRLGHSLVGTAFASDRRGRRGRARGLTGFALTQGGRRLIL